MFNLVEIVAGNPVIILDDVGSPLSFTTGALAAFAAKELSASKGVKVQPRRVSDDSWKLREAARLASGTYQALPWSSEDWFKSNPRVADHFPHVSTDKEGMVAYTQDADKGAADIQTCVKLGRYLTQYFDGILGSEEIKRLAVEFSERFEDNELQMTDDADEMERVYVEGPRSCMSYSAASYSGSEHPVRVYAAGDLQLAYLERDGDITARCLVWPDRLIYSRIYGDEQRMMTLLEARGYSDGTLQGARLRKIEESRGRYVMPYIDCTPRAADHGKYLKIDEDGDIGARETGGLSAAVFTCEECGDSMDEDDTYCVDDSSWCRHCYENHAMFCERTQIDTRADGSRDVTTRNWQGTTFTQRWSASAVERFAFRCAVTDDYFDDNLGIEMEGTASGETWSITAFEEGGFVCEGNGGNYPIADLVNLDDRSQWSQEHFDDHGKEVDGVFYRAEDAPADAKAYRCDNTLELALETPEEKTLAEILELA